MVSTQAISFTSNSVVADQQRKDRTQTQEQVAAGVGGAAGVGKVAKMAGRKSAQAGFTSGGQVIQGVTSGVQTINRGKTVATGLWANFKSNIKMYTASIMQHLEKFKNTKIIGSIIKSPVTKKVSALLGGALAFFVLVTGINTAVRNGELAVNDLKSKIKEVKEG